jgi:3-hydroxyacyl-[acyl-carrier-protein] dehydratase
MTRFTQIDRVLQLVPGRRLVAVKNLSLTEEYLHDHFPRFPVMPGVIMLESMYQGAAWLVRATDQFRHSMVVLQEAKNVKFADFVQPGDQLVVTCEWMNDTPQTVTLKCEGTVSDRSAVKARLMLHRFNLAERDPSEAPVDRHMILTFQEQFALLYPQGADDWQTAAAGA